MQERNDVWFLSDWTLATFIFSNMTRDLSCCPVLSWGWTSWPQEDQPCLTAAFLGGPWQPDTVFYQEQRVCSERVRHLDWNHDQTMTEFCLSAPECLWDTLMVHYTSCPTRSLKGGQLTLTVTGCIIWPQFFLSPHIHTLCCISQLESDTHPLTLNLSCNWLCPVKYPWVRYLWGLHKMLSWEHT